MKCEKCQDVGFIEHNAGLLTEFCDCEKGKEILAQKRAIYGIPEDKNWEVKFDDSGTEPDDQPVGSPDTSEPKQPSKSKKKKKSRKRTK